MLRTTALLYIISIFLKASLLFFSLLYTNESRAHFEFIATVVDTSNMLKSFFLASGRTSYAQFEFIAILYFKASLLSSLPPPTSESHTHILNLLLLFILKKEADIIMMLL